MLASQDCRYSQLAGKCSQFSCSHFFSVQAAHCFQIAVVTGPAIQRRQRQNVVQGMRGYKLGRHLNSSTVTYLDWLTHWLIQCLTLFVLYVTQLQCTTGSSTMANVKPMRSLTASDFFRNLWSSTGTTTSLSKMQIIIYCSTFLLILPSLRIWKDNVSKKLRQLHFEGVGDESIWGLSELTTGVVSGLPKFFPSAHPLRFTLFSADTHARSMSVHFERFDKCLQFLYQVPRYGSRWYIGRLF